MCLRVERCSGSGSIVQRLVRFPGNESGAVNSCTHACRSNAAATTAARARSLAAAVLALAALSLAVRCYASSLEPSTHHSLHPREAPAALTTTTTTSSPSRIVNNSTEVRVHNSARYNAAPVSHNTSRPMPPVIQTGSSSLHEHQQDTHTTNTVSGESGASSHPDTVDRSGGGGGGLLALLVGATLLTATLGLITCVVSHYRGGTAPPPPHDAPHTSQPYITAPMLSVMSAGAAAGVGVAAAGGGGDGGGRLHRHMSVSRDLAAQRDRQVRLHSVHTDLELDLPPSIALPDGEELPYGSSARLHIRDPEQESEIYQKCIRAPPNRTVFESESPPPYRSSSAGLLGSLGSSSSGGSDWSAGSTPLVVRCHSMSSSTATKSHHHHPHQHQQHSAPSSSQKTDFLQRTVKILTGRKSSSSSSQPPAPTLPSVVVPARPRRLDPRSPHV